jgi:protein-disulfide isomerase
MSNKREREKRREERIAAESAVGSEDRRKRILQLASGLVFLVIIAAVVAVVVSSSSNGSSGDTQLEEVAAVKQLVGSTPQQELVLGDKSAPVELIEFGDLQCPICKAYSEEILPAVIENKIETGKATLTFRNFTIISEESVPAGAAAIAAGKQGKGWNFIELFYRNQGEERSGYVTDEFLEAIAKGAGVPNMAKWQTDREAPATTEEVEATTAEAEKIGFTGTPSFAIKGPKTNGLEILENSEDPATYEEAIEKAS